jgi:hypothetical protein
MQNSIFRGRWSCFFQSKNRAYNFQNPLNDWNSKAEATIALTITNYLKKPNRDTKLKIW